MKRLPVLWLLALLPLSGAAGKTVAFEQVVPDDVNLLVVLEAEALISGWSALPLVELWNDPQLQGFVAPFRSSLETNEWSESVEATTGRSVEDTLGLFTDKVVLGMTDLPAMIAAGDDAWEAGGFFLLAAVKEGADDLWQKLADPRFGPAESEIDENAEYSVETEELDGVELHVWQTITEDGVEDGEGWAVVDNMLVVARPRALLRRLVAAVQSGADDSPLAESAAFTIMRGDLDGSDLLIYTDLRAALAAMESAIAADPPEPNPMGITPEDIIEALGLRDLEAAYMSVRVTAQPTRIDYGIVYKKPSGLLQMFAMQPGVDARPSLVPAAALGASVGNFDWMQMWTALHDIAERISPPLVGMADAQIQQLGAGLEIDLVKAILGNFGKEMVSVNFPAESDGPDADNAAAVMNSLVAISVADRQSVELGIEALQSLAGPGVELFETSEYLGTDIHVSQPFPGGPGPDSSVMAYALTDGWLLLGLGSAEPVRQALAQIANPGRTFWESPQVRAGLAQLPPGAGLVGYADMATQFAGLLDGVLAAQGMAAEEGDDEDAMFDASARPDAELFARYFGAAVSGAYKNNRSLRFTVLLLPPAP